MNRGITLVELLVTLAIFAGVLTLGIVSLRGYYPKQQLIASVQNLENSLNRAQSEASSRSHWTCVKFTAVGTEIWVDRDGNHEDGPAACGNSGDPPDIQIGTPLSFRGRTHLAFDSTGTNVVWFNTASQPQRCISGSGCVNVNVELILSNDDLQSGGKAREVEVGAGGLIQIVKPGEVGLIPDNWAKFGSEGGSGARE